MKILSVLHRSKRQAGLGAPFSKLTSRLPKHRGFTLAELLIAVMILGQIATFTIPKILTSQQNSRNVAIVKEAASMAGAAYQSYTLQNTLASTTRSRDFTQYMNYVNIETSAPMDDTPAGTTVPCASYLCLRLHNGALMSLQMSNESFGGTATTNGVIFLLDPDGKASSTKAVLIFVYYNGRVATQGSCTGSLVSSVYTYGCNPTRDPSWFSW